MNSRRAYSRVGIPVLLATLFLGPPAHAQAAPATPKAREEAPEPFIARPVSEAMLAEVSGKQDRPTWQSASATSNANSHDNEVGDHSPTGALSVSDSAFQNVSGISMVNLNTGNASSINASLNVNLSISMAPASSPNGM